MAPFILVALVLIARGLLELCRDTPRGGVDFLALMASGVLPVSKKARGRGQIVGRRR